jgi:hypothetical protein
MCLTQACLSKQKEGGKERMKRVIVLLTAIFLAAITLSPLPAAAQDDTHVTGGGTGTFGADLDGDGDIDGSQFGMGVNILGGGVAKGHFECLMAGRSDIFGLALMAVEGKVSSGTVGGGSATFGGTARVNLGNGDILTGVPFIVTVAEGGTGVGTLTLTVIAAGFDGVPGDTIIGNNQLDLPTETVSSGQIKIH